MLEKIAPTIIEIGRALKGKEEISDANFVKWSKALDRHGRNFAK